MRLIRLELGNFKPFAGHPHAFGFGDGKPGLHMVCGVNMAHPEKGANGVGKTSLWDGVYWVLYGKTPRGVRGADVRTWHSKGDCYGQLELEAIGGHGVIRRQQGPNKLTLALDGGEPVPAEQGAIDAFIGMDAELFKYAVLQPQMEDFFFDLQPAAKLALFTSLLDLDHWSDWSKAAGRMTADQERVVLRCKASTESANAVETSELRSLEELDRHQADWKNHRQEDLREAERRLGEARKSLTIREANAADARAELTRCANIEKAAKEDSERHATSKARADEDERVARADRQRASTALGAAKSALATFKAAPDSCPTCGSRLTAKQRAAEIDRLEDAVAEAANRQADVEAAEDARRRAADAAGKELEGARRREADAKRSADDADAHWGDCCEKAGLAKTEITHHEVRIAELSGGVGPYADLIASGEAKLKEARAVVDAAVEARTKAETEYAALAYWQNGFRDLRLELVEDALASFEIEVNNQLSDLGLWNWSVALAIERETKSGGVMRGFSVMVTSPESRGPVPWESWSGGETQRLRLAGTMGFASLIMRRTGVNSAPMVLDEPTEHLTPEGVNDLLSLLALRARTRGQQIWIIDHRGVDFGDVASVTRIINRKTGASIDTGAPPPPVRKRLKESA